MLETINRDALIIFPKQPFFDWLDGVYSDDKHKCPAPLTHDKGTVYLIPEHFNTDDSVKELKLNFKLYFEIELFGWCEDEKYWPKKLTWLMFEQWFHYSIQSTVLDVVDDEIEKEDY